MGSNHTISDQQAALEPMDGQMQLVTIEQVQVADRVPKYADIILTAEQIEEARVLWPAPKNSKGEVVTDPEKQERMRRHYMRMKIWYKIRHDTIVDPKTGRRAFGGFQPKSKKAQRIDEKLVAAADDRSSEIIDAAFSALDPKNESWIRHRAAMNISKEARAIRELEIKEDELEKASSDDLARETAQILVEMIRKGEIDVANISSFIDGEAEVVEIELPELAELTDG